MAGGYDIGPKVGIDGFAEFNKAIKSINDDVKGFGSELKLVAAIYDENGESMEALAAKNEVLQKTYDAQARKVEEIQKALEKARTEYGENADATKKWQRSLTDAQTALQKTSNEIGKNQRKLDDLENSTEDLKDAFDGVDDSVKDAQKALNDIGDSAEKTSGKFNSFKVAAGNLVSGGISAIASAVGNAVSSLANLDESTEEYRMAMGKLNTAFETAGYSSDVAGKAYTDLYKILGDTGTVAEASQLMANMAKSEQDFADWTTIAAGVAGTFGDALPINSLIEAANETAKVGEVTGALADALNWAGISEDEFNAQLAACSSESARNDKIMNTLVRTYDEAADAFYKNNEAVIKSREAQAQLDEATGKLGESIAGVKNALIEKFGPAIADAAEKAAEFINGVDTDELFRKFDEAVDGISTAFEWGWDKITGIYDLAPSYFDEKSDYIGHVFDTLEALWNGDFESAWDSALKTTTDQVASLVGLSMDIKKMFSDLDWSVDFEKAWEGVKKATETAWNSITEIAQDIWGAITDGYNEGVQNHNANSSTTGGNNVNRSDNSAYWSQNRAPVYLDGKKVGTVLNGVNGLSEIAAGMDIATIP